MATQFSDLYPLIRALVDDTDSEAYYYSNPVLDSHISLQAMATGDATLAFTGTTFDNEITNIQKVIITANVAKALVSMMLSEFSYKTPVMTAKRKRTIPLTLVMLDNLLAEASGGKILAIEEGEIEAIVKFPERLISELCQAYMS